MSGISFQTSQPFSSTSTVIESAPDMARTRKSNTESRQSESDGNIIPPALARQLANMSPPLAQSETRPRIVPNLPSPQVQPQPLQPSEYPTQTAQQPQVQQAAQRQPPPQAAPVPEPVESEEQKMTRKLERDYVSAINTYCSMRNEWTHELDKLRELNGGIGDFMPGIEHFLEDSGPTMKECAEDVHALMLDSLHQLEEYHMRVSETEELMEKLELVWKFINSKAAGDNLDMEMELKLKEFRGRIGKLDEKFSHLRMEIDKAKDLAATEKPKSSGRKVDNSKDSREFTLNTKRIGIWCMRSYNELLDMISQVNQLNTRLGKPKIVPPARQNIKSSPECSKTSPAVNSNATANRSATLTNGSLTTATFDDSTVSNATNKTGSSPSRADETVGNLQKEVLRCLQLSDRLDVHAKRTMATPANSMEQKSLREKLKQVANSPKSRPNLVSVGTQSPSLVTKPKARTPQRSGLASTPKSSTTAALPPATTAAASGSNTIDVGTNAAVSPQTTVFTPKENKTSVLSTPPVSSSIIDVGSNAPVSAFTPTDNKTSAPAAPSVSSSSTEVSSNAVVSLQTFVFSPKDNKTSVSSTPPVSSSSIDVGSTAVASPQTTLFTPKDNKSSAPVAGPVPAAAVPSLATSATLPVTAPAATEDGMDQDMGAGEASAPVSHVNFSFNSMGLGTPKPAAAAPKPNFVFNMFSNASTPQKSSLFGGGGAAPAVNGGSGSSLFGGNASGAGGGGSLFGGGGSGGGSSLFGGGAAPASGGMTSSLFGGTAAPAPSNNTGGSGPNSLFGGGATFGSSSPFSSNTPATAPAVSASPFSGKAFGSAGQQQQKTFGMFSGQGAASPTLFGQAANGTSGGGASSLFGSAAASPVSNGGSASGGSSLFGGGPSFGSASPFQQATPFSSVGGKSTAFTQMRK